MRARRGSSASKLRNMRKGGDENVRVCVGLTSWIAAAVVSLLAGQARTIQQAVFGKADQRTPEVSTEELRRILAEGSGTVLECAGPSLSVHRQPHPRRSQRGGRPGVPMSMYILRCGRD